MLTITEDVKGKCYKQLIDFLLRHCDRFAFVEDRRLMKDEESRLAYVHHLITYIETHLIERNIQKKWETTELTDATAYVFYFRLNNVTAVFLKDFGNSLFDWRNPKLPEDLMFYKNDKCILASCSHEKYFLVDPDFWARFSIKG